jgi:hypothetical protein
MRAYLTGSFDRDAKRDGISDGDCQEAIRKAERGLIDADLGGGLIKQRIPRGNQGAARGSRAVVFYRRGEVAVFLHVFPKSRKANLKKSELAEYLKAAQVLEKLSEEAFFAARDKKGWRLIEI